MKIIYDPHTDTLDMILREGQAVESDEEKPGIILDYDKDGNILAIEVLEASKQLSTPIGVSFELATAPIPI